MIITCSLEKVVASSIVDGTINSDRFITHLKKVKREIPFRERRQSIIILDNCPSHRSRATKEWMSQNRLRCHYLVPYSPEHNFAELLIGRHKEILRCYLEQLM